MMDTRDADHELNIEISENDVRKGIRRQMAIESEKAKERQGVGGCANICTGYH